MSILTLFPQAEYTTRPMKEGDKPGCVINTRPMTAEELKAIGPNVTAEICERYGYEAVESCVVCERGTAVTLRECEKQRIYALQGPGNSGWLHFPGAPIPEQTWIHIGKRNATPALGIPQLQSAYIKSLKCRSGRLPFAVWCRGTYEALEAAGRGLIPLWTSGGADMPWMETCAETLVVAKALMIPFPTYGTKEWDAAIEGLLNEDTSGCLVITNYGEQKGGGR